VDLDEAVFKHFKVSKVGSKEDSWMLDRATPANAFRNYLVYSARHNAYWTTTVKNETKETVDELAFRLLDIAIAGYEPSKKDCLEIFVVDASPKLFTRLLVAPPSCHETLKIESPQTHKSLRLALPAFPSEFDGTEEADYFRLVRQTFVPTTDWTRAPRPRLLMRFNNEKTKCSSIKKFGLARVEVLYQEIRVLSPDEKSFVEIKNIVGQTARFITTGSAIVVTVDSASKTFISSEEAIAWSFRFLCLSEVV